MDQPSNTYYMPRDDDLLCVFGGSPAPDLARFVHHQLRTLISVTDFPCVVARAAFRVGSYRLGIYEHMASVESSMALSTDLRLFVNDRRSLSGQFNTFAAIFKNPGAVDERYFELLLWSQLQRLHEIDDQAWDQRVSADPHDSKFEFSFAGEAFFVVGLHAAASRWSRRFGWPTLVFNGHDQFRKLRDSAKMERFQQIIRGRDIKLQGTVNPNLADFGNSSDARQYSGRPIEQGWTCPFQPRS